jgi:ABC-type branched-subunit amino acid transport system substrate-binding protein
MARHARYLSWVAVGAAGLVVMAACGSSKKSPASTATTAATGSGTSATTAAASKYPPIPAGPIKVGISVPLSGATAAFGIATKAAFENVTLKTWNAANPGGIDGHPVQLDILDDASDVTKAVAVANQFVADKDTAVITASYNPAAAPQQIAVLNKAKVPALIQVAQDVYNNPSKFPYLFGMGSDDMLGGEALAAYVGKHPEYQKLAVLTDGSEAQVEIQSDFTTALKTSAPSANVVKSVTISPGAVDVSTAIAQLKSANPDFLIINVGYGYGPIWQAMKTANWSPKFYVSGSAFYDGYSGLGALAANGVTVTTNCATTGHAPFPSVLTDAMNAYATVFGSSSVNYILYYTSDNAPLDLLKLAVEKYHSTDPDAIKQAIENLGPIKLGGVIDYNFSPTNHYGQTGPYGTNVCTISNFSDGPYRLPVVAP